MAYFYLLDINQFKYYVAFFSLDCFRSSSFISGSREHNLNWMLVCSTLCVQVGFSLLTFPEDIGGHLTPEFLLSFKVLLYSDH